MSKAWLAVLFLPFASNFLFVDQKEEAGTSKEVALFERTDEKGIGSCSICEPSLNGTKEEASLAGCSRCGRPPNKAIEQDAPLQEKQDTLAGCSRCGRPPNKMKEGEPLHSYPRSNEVQNKVALSGPQGISEKDSSPAKPPLSALDFPSSHSKRVENLDEPQVMQMDEGTSLQKEGEQGELTKHTDESSSPSAVVQKEGENGIIEQSAGQETAVSHSDQEQVTVSEPAISIPKADLQVKAKKSGKRNSCPICPKNKRVKSKGCRCAIDSRIHESLASPPSQ